jgi:hypothetical protein
VNNLLWQEHHEKKGSASIATNWISAMIPSAPRLSTEETSLDQCRRRLEDSPIAAMYIQQTPSSEFPGVPNLAQTIHSRALCNRQSNCST